jgi:TonB family protein
MLISRLLLAEAPAGPTVNAGSYIFGMGATAEPTIMGPYASYTAEARKAHIGGRVVLMVAVGKDHCAHNIKVVEPLGYGLDESAVDAVKRSTFRFVAPIVRIEIPFFPEFSMITPLSEPTCEPQSSKKQQ